MSEEELKLAEEQEEIILDEPIEEKEEAKPEEVKEVKAEPEKEFSDVEKEAYEKGWRPDAGPKSAEEFLRDGPLYEEIKARGREIQDLKKTLQNLTSHLTKQQEIGYKKAVDDLQAQRLDAIQAGDVAKVDEIEAAMKEQESTLPGRDNHPAVQSFMERHRNWIQDPSFDSQKMREFAQKRDEQLMEYNLDPEEHIRVLEKDLRAEFSHRFENPNKESPPAVESAGLAASDRAGPTVAFRELNDAQKQVYRYLERNSAKEAKAYVKQLVELGEIEGRD